MWYVSASEGKTHGVGNSSMFLSACLLKSLVLVSQILGGASEKQPGMLMYKMSQEDGFIAPLAAKEEGSELPGS